MNFKMKKKVDHIDKQIYRSIIISIDKVEIKKVEKLEIVLKVV